MFVILRGTVTFQGKDVHAGTGIVLPEASAKSLVASGLAEFVTADEQNGEVDVSKAAEGTNTQEADAIAKDDALAKLTKALDDQYKRDELATEAKAVGVEFPYNAKKDEIITAVIAQGKEAALLK